MTYKHLDFNLRVQSSRLRVQKPCFLVELQRHRLEAYLEQ